MRESVKALLFEVRSLIHGGQQELAALAGVSRRTVQRWDSGSSSVSSLDLEKIAAALHPKYPEMAARVAAATGRTLVDLGLEAPPRAPVAAGPTVPSYSVQNVRHLVDSLVCAAADASGVLPSALRPALLAAFTRARELSLDVPTVERALRDGESAG